MRLLEANVKSFFQAKHRQALLQLFDNLKETGVRVYFQQPC